MRTSTNISIHQGSLPSYFLVILPLDPSVGADRIRATAAMVVGVAEAAAAVVAVAVVVADVNAVSRTVINSFRTKLFPVFKRAEAIPLKQNNQTNRCTFKI